MSRSRELRVSADRSREMTVISCVQMQRNMLDSICFLEYGSCLLAEAPSWERVSRGSILEARY